MKNYRVGIIGATGYVGQRLMLLLKNHPFFTLTHLFASERSAGKSYQEAVQNRFRIEGEKIPEKYAQYPVYSTKDIFKFKDELDFVFCAVDMPKEEVKALEISLAKMDIPVVSNNSALRMDPLVPMIIPEINAEHLALIENQKKVLGTKRGFVVCKPNCSIQSYVPALTPLLKFKPKKLMVATYQAISGAGKTFESWPEMKENLIPFINGEEAKSEEEPHKIWAKYDEDAGQLIPQLNLDISAQCYRVAVAEGHTAAVWVEFENKPSKQEILDLWKAYESPLKDLDLPHAPNPFLIYHEEDNRPQPKLDAETNGFAIHLGRLREDKIFSYKFTCLSHNTLRGAAGGALLTAELLAKKKYFDR